jgi:hypothetical protein
VQPQPNVFAPVAIALQPLPESTSDISAFEGALFVGVPAVGLLMVLTGSIVYSQAPGDELCGLSGCVTRRSRLLENAGTSLMAGGLGLTVSAFSLAAFAGGVPAGRERRSKPVALLGYGLVAGSLASLGVGIAQGATYDSDFDDLSTAWPWWFASGLGAVAGIPLLAVGSSLEPLPEPQTGGVALEHHSIPMAVTGGVFVGLGGLAALAGSVIGVADLSTGAFGGYGAILLGPSLFGGSMVLAAVGVPLMVVGLRREAVGVARSGPTSAEAALVPQLSVGPLGASATWGLP